ncbi:MAG: HAD hydrolase family protein [Ignavibacteriae bacterium]|nr:HAD hydrolase family protein [Ignavibacteriota bacterium]
MKKKKNPDLSKIQFLLMDMDGCLSTGQIIFSSTGDDIKIFHTHDGFGITRGRKFGLKFAVISGMGSKVNKIRVDRLKIDYLFENIDDKRIPYEELKKKHNLKDENFAYIGDDEFDLPLLMEVGFSCCPNNAMDDVKKHVNYVCKKNGGEGAVREIIDKILKAKKII